MPHRGKQVMGTSNSNDDDMVEVQETIATTWGQ